MLEQRAWVEHAVAEVNEAVDRAQREIVLVPVADLRTCHVRHIDRLERLQREVQNDGASTRERLAVRQLRMMIIVREKAVELALQGGCAHADEVRWSARGLPEADEYPSPPYDPLYLETSSPSLTLRW